MGKNKPPNTSDPRHSQYNGFGEIGGHSLRQHGRMADSLKGLGTSLNPYSVNPDDGIYVDIQGDMGDDGPPEISNFESQETGEMPGREEVLERFEEHLEIMGPLIPKDEEKMRHMTLKERWNEISRKSSRAPIFQVDYYVDNLKKCMNTQSKKSAGKKKRQNDGTPSLSFYLTKLKRDLAETNEEFVRSFIADPNNGIQLLVSLLIDIQRDISLAQQSRKTNSNAYRQDLESEQDCLLCIKYSTNNSEGMKRLLFRENAITMVTASLVSESINSKVYTLRLLTKVCDESQFGGLEQVMKGLDQLHLRYYDLEKFKTLTDLLNKSSSEVHVQIACVRFFNKLWTGTDNANAKVHLQFELQLAGFDPDFIDRYTLSTGVEFEELQRDLEIWRGNYINVVSSRQEQLDLQTRNNQLRQEVNRLQDNIKKADEESQKMLSEHQKEKEKSDQYRERAAELRDTVNHLTQLYIEKTGENPSDDVDIGDVNRPIELYGAETVKPIPVKKRPPATPSGDNVSDIPDREPPPTAPDLPPANTMAHRVTTSGVNMPLIIWTPLYSVRHTIFETIDERAIRDIDFKDFEQNFQLVSSGHSTDRSVGKISTSDKLTFINRDKSKNMIITMRRTGLTALQIHEAIDKCDIDKLPGEYAELLLKFTPTRDEIRQLSENEDQYHNMADAEQFLLKMATVERLESKLRIMQFMGSFNETLTDMIPNIQAIQKVSQSVLVNTKLRQIFQIILSLGNYLNSGKREYAHGFRLESLSKLKEVKSADRKFTLLHYIVDLIEKYYPNLAKFYEDLEVAVEKGVSYQAIASDVQGFRKGLDLIKYEREKQPNNNRIEIFHAASAGKITNVAESFHKMEESYKAVCALFGESHRHMEPDELFKQLNDFLREFKQASEENYKRKNPEEFLTSPRPVRVARFETPSTSKTENAVKTPPPQKYRPSTPPPYPPSTSPRNYPASPTAERNVPLSPQYPKENAEFSPAPGSKEHAKLLAKQAAVKRRSTFMQKAENDPFPRTGYMGESLFDDYLYDDVQNEPQKAEPTFLVGDSTEPGTEPEPEEPEIKENGLEMEPETTSKPEFILEESDEKDPLYSFVKKPSVMSKRDSNTAPADAKKKGRKLQRIAIDTDINSDLYKAEYAKQGPSAGAVFVQPTNNQLRASHVYEELPYERYQRNRNVVNGDVPTSNGQLERSSESQQVDEALATLDNVLADDTMTPESVDSRL